MATSGPRTRPRLVSHLRTIRTTVVVGLIVLMITLAPCWLLGMGILMQEAGGRGGD